jgi:replication-associated recombination protein RarA
LGSARQREDHPRTYHRRPDEVAFRTCSAVTAGVADLRRIVEEARERRGMYGQRTLLFIDDPTA